MSGSDILYIFFDAFEFDKLFGNYFGHHAVALGLCTINVPYYFMTAASLLYLILGIMCFFFYEHKFVKTYTGLWSSNKSII